MSKQIHRQKTQKQTEKLQTTGSKKCKHEQYQTILLYNSPYVKIFIFFLSFTVKKKVQYINNKTKINKKRFMS